MRLAGGNRKTIAFPYDRSTWSTPPQSRRGRAAAEGEPMVCSQPAEGSLGGSTIAVAHENDSNGAIPQGKTHLTEFGWGTVIVEPL